MKKKVEKIEQNEVKNTNAHRWIDEVLSKCVKSLVVVDDESTASEMMAHMRMFVLSGTSTVPSDTTLYSNISKYSDMSLALRKRNLSKRKNYTRKTRPDHGHCCVVTLPLCYVV